MVRIPKVSAQRRSMLSRERQTDEQFAREHVEEAPRTRAALLERAR